MSVDTFTISASGKPIIRKDPDAILDYTWDWTDYLADVTDTIASFVLVLSTGLTSSSSSHTANTVIAFIAGGVLADPGKPVTIETATCRITTTGGRVDDRTIYLKIVER